MAYIKRNIYKRWLIAMLALALLAIGGVWSLNYFIDPFEIFNSKTLIYPYHLNDRVAKISYLDKNHSKYNSYLFGSSRMGSTSPKSFEKYMPGASIYNFNITSGNISEYLTLLEYMLESGYPVKIIIIQIDIDNMINNGSDQEDLISKHHYRVTKTSPLKYYFDILTAMPLLNWHGKSAISHTPKDRRKKLYDLKTGQLFYTNKDRLIDEDHDLFVSKMSHTHHTNRTIIGTSGTIHNSVHTLNKINLFCKINDIRMIVYTTPHNYSWMNKFDLPSYLEYLKSITSITDFWDFSGYNSITLNDYNYYEESHYLNNISQLIAARIFNDNATRVPDDFGYHLNLGNINDYLEYKRDEITAYEERFIPQ